MKNLGIDLGNVVFRKGEVVPDAFETIQKLVPQFTNVYIVSRVNFDQKERSLAALKITRFFEFTGIPPENLYYCFERRDKAVFQRGLNIRFFIDDRYDCLAPMENWVTKILFNPDATDLQKFQDNQPFNMGLVRDWREVEKYYLDAVS